MGKVNGTIESFGKASEIFSVEGKKALITGGSKGLGRAMALCLLENGCDIAVCSRHAVTDTDDMVEYAKSLGRICFPYNCDVTKSKDVGTMVDSVLEALGGRIDILINSAGVGILKFIPEMDDDSWNTVINMNLTSTFIVTREVCNRAMIPQHYGKIINMSSMKSVMGTALTGHSAYAASKGGVSMFTKQAACELAQYGITVSALGPTYIKTEINATQFENPEFREKLVRRIPAGRIGEFKDLMGLTLLLASDASEFLTGQTYLIVGGIAARQE